VVWIKILALQVSLETPYPPKKKTSTESGGGFFSRREFRSCKTGRAHSSNCLVRRKKCYSEWGCECCILLNHEDFVSPPHFN